MAASSTLECNVPFQCHSQSIPDFARPAQDVESRERELRRDFSAAVIRVWVITIMMFVVAMLVVSIIEKIQMR